MFPTTHPTRLSFFSFALPFRIMPRNAVQLTCEQCKQRKTKCDKGSPCSACRAGDLTCTPVQRARLPRGKTGKGRSKNAALESKVARLESLVGRLETQFRGDGIVNDANGMSDLAANPKPVDFGGKIENTIARDFWLAISSEVSHRASTTQSVLWRAESRTWFWLCGARSHEPASYHVARFEK